jgi:CheY-like chemotaxis protein
MLMQVLLFEDECGIAKMLRRTLERHGYHVTVTAELNDARQMLERVKFDLIIANILLPDGTAFEVMEMARQRGIRTFLMTGGPSYASRSPAAAAKTGRRLPPETAAGDRAGIVVDLTKPENLPAHLTKPPSRRNHRLVSRP